MQVKAGLERLALISAKSFAERSFPVSAPGTEWAGPGRATHEVYAYIAVRDVLLAEAEEHPVCATLDSVSIANELVETFLQPSRPPYQAQALPEEEAFRKGSAVKP